MDKIYIWIAWHLPKVVVKWCAIRMSAFATRGLYSSMDVSDLRIIDALDRWNLAD